jgi:fumarylacetoacetase
MLLAAPPRPRSYWTFQQMVAHHTAGGCNLQPGDLLGSGTVSGPQEGERGCLLELTWGGSRKLALRGSSGSSVERVYLADGDEVVFRGRCEGQGGLLPGIGFGECRGRLLPCAYTKQ